MTDTYYAPIQRLKLPVPDDALTLLPTLTRNMAARHYGVSSHTVRRWCVEIGVETRQLTPDEWSLLSKRACRARHGGVERLPPDPNDVWPRDLYVQAMRAFDLAHSEITEEDYA